VTVATPGEWQCKTGSVRRLAVANGPNIFQMLLVILSMTLIPAALVNKTKTRFRQLVHCLAQTRAKMGQLINVWEQLNDNSLFIYFYWTYVEQSPGVLGDALVTFSSKSLLLGSFKQRTQLVGRHHLGRVYAVTVHQPNQVLFVVDPKHRPELECRQ